MKAAMTALLLLTPALAAADTARGGGELPVRPLAEGMLDQMRWNARPLVVLGEGLEADAQLDALQAASAELAEREVVLLRDGPGAASLREQVGDGFAVLLIGKDGGVKLSRNSQVEPSEIIALIDSMPMRRNEAQ